MRQPPLFGLKLRRRPTAHAVLGPTCDVDTCSGPEVGTEGKHRDCSADSLLNDDLPGHAEALVEAADVGERALLAERPGDSLVVDRDRLVVVERLDSPGVLPNDVLP